MAENTSKSMKKFMTIWTGQFFSILGSGLSSFGLSIWVLQQTSSNMSFAMTFLVQILPGIIFAPMAGSFADRKNRKKIMILTDSIDAALKVLMVALVLTEVLKLWMVYPILFLSSTLNAFQGPAFDASVPQIVPKEQLGRANGLRQLTRSVQSMIAPIAAGAFYPMIGFSGLLVIDFCTFGIAIVTLALQSIPQPTVSDETGGKNRALADMKFAMEYLRGKQGFLSLISVFALLNFIANLCVVLIGPVIMANYDSKFYGLVNSASGVAMVVGGFVAGLFPVTEHRVRKIFLSLILSGIGLCIMGKSPMWAVVAAGGFVFMLPVPFANGTFGTMVHMKFSGEVLGRVGALMGGLMSIVTPVAILLAGFLSDRVFNPLLMPDGALANTWAGRFFGVGEQRGVGLLFVLCGLILIVTCIATLCNKKVMDMEDVNEDVI